MFNSLLESVNLDIAREFGDLAQATYVCKSTGQAFAVPMVFCSNAFGEFDTPDSPQIRAFVAGASLAELGIVPMLGDAVYRADQTRYQVGDVQTDQGGGVSLVLSKVE